MLYQAKLYFVVSLYVSQNILGRIIIKKKKARRLSTSQLELHCVDAVGMDTVLPQGYD